MLTARRGLSTGNPAAELGRDASYNRFILSLGARLAPVVNEIPGVAPHGRQVAFALVVVAITVPCAPTTTVKSKNGRMWMAGWVFGRAD